MWPNPQETADLVKFTEEILNGKLYFLCSARDSSINRLLSIIHDIYKSLYEGYELRGVFLDISRQQNGISGNLQERLPDFLRYGKKRVALNGQVF